MLRENSLAGSVSPSSNLSLQRIFTPSKPNLGIVSAHQAPTLYTISKKNAIGKSENSLRIFASLPPVLLVLLHKINSVLRKHKPLGKAAHKKSVQALPHSIAEESRTHKPFGDIFSHLSPNIVSQSLTLLRQSSTKSIKNLSAERCYAVFGEQKFFHPKKIFEGI